MPPSLTVRAASAALFAAERRRVAALEPLSQKYPSAPCVYGGDPCGKTDVRAGKEYWAARAAALGRYLDELKAIRFPDVAASEAGVHIGATGTIRDLALSASKATTVDTFNARKSAAVDAQNATDGIHELKVALGMPEP
jgi:hypothetical protein